MSTARIVFVTGLSGAGKSQAIKTLEDLGFYCVEHLPPAALDATLQALDAARTPDIAISLYEHGDPLLGDALAAIERAARTRSVDVLYLEARNDALVRRFSETRRRHPFESRGSLRDAIAAERAALLPLRERATMTIDTTVLTHGGLKERLAAAFAPNERAQLAVTIVPFGFKYGLPLDLDLLFDVRFLRNPNYDDVLRPLTGQDEAVVKFIEDDPACAPFVAKLNELMDFLIPRYIAEGKARLTVGIGCTGGRHRSVYVANRLYDHLATNERVALAVDPRDVGR
ncbi:MAG TPA: RNase adapter RapZ [Candidatus Baltobacteraceae bacterium]|nr:RNase adapter RapZ [Candidatus Baltobacteraceae bacterium]